MKRIAAAAIVLMITACGGADKKTAGVEGGADAAISVIGADELAGKFVRLGLALGEHDPAYVDAYSGPPEWADAAKAEKRSLDQLAADADEILEALEILKRRGDSPRERGLERQTIAAKTRIRMARGEKFSFDEEARLLYGVSPPVYSLADFDAALSEIDSLLPGNGALVDRVNAFKDSLAISEDKRRPVLEAAIAECKARTVAHLTLPEGERFELGFVTDKPWSGYNWYQGDYASKIEVNTDLPVTIDRAVGLGCHEGYPGHHVWNLVVERDLKRANGWIEYSILPLFSPQGVVGEGSANYGVRLAFPGNEKTAFERDVLFPLAGLDPAKAETMEALEKAQARLSHSANHIAREYLDGRIDRETAIGLYMNYQLSARQRAEQRLDFIDAYRSYVINYTVGEDLVARYVEAEAAMGVDPWIAFEALLKNPDPISSLVKP